MPKITILKDDREKKGWSQNYFGDDFKVVQKRLKVGDYTIKGLEHLVVIEKKRNWEEIANNISSKTNRTNFELELIRMQSFPIRFLIINDDLIGLRSMEQYSQMVTPQVIANWICRIEMEFGVSIIMLGKKHTQVAKYMTREVFKRAYNHNKGIPSYYHTVPDSKQLINKPKKAPKKLKRPAKRK